MPNTSTKQASVNDIPSLYPLLTQMGSKDSEDSIKKRLLRYLSNKDHYIVVAVHNNKLAGYAWAQSYGEHLRDGKITAKFHDLFVDHNYRHLGIGKILFEEVKKWAKKNHVSYLQWQSSKSAIKFYEKLGLKGDTKSDLKEHPFYEIEFKY